MNLYFVFLRRPQSKRDQRNDPFWEFGSFGLTGCHRTNLLNPRTSPLNDGDRLVFLQGGKGEVRVVGMPPPIRLVMAADRVEVRWDEGYRPIPFKDAPTLIDNAGRCKFSGVSPFLENTRRSTHCGAIASRLRSKTTPVSALLASQLRRYFDRSNLAKVNSYLDAIEPASNNWHKDAYRRGWHETWHRQMAFLQLTDAPESAVTSTAMAMASYGTTERRDACGRSRQPVRDSARPASCRPKVRPSFTSDKLHRKRGL